MNTIPHLRPCAKTDYSADYQNIIECGYGGFTAECVPKMHEVKHRCKEDIRTQKPPNWFVMFDRSLIILLKAIKTETPLSSQWSENIDSFHPAGFNSERYCWRLGAGPQEKCLIWL